MIYSLKEIASITDSSFIGNDSTVNSVITDSRITNIAQPSVFVAIRGTNHDGHNYISQLYDKGVRAFIIDKPINTNAFPEAGFIISENSLTALHRLAAYHRKNFKGIVIAITGSNGKTVTKEWIAQLCPKGVKIFRSPKSYNSQIGVPLSILMLNGDEQIAVIEAGISQRGEMERLEKIISPNIGILTNIGDAHQENFASMDEKLHEKLLLFKNSDTIIYNSSNNIVDNAINRLYGNKTLFPVTKNSYDLRSMATTDNASLDNATEAIALYETLGYEPKRILQKLPLLQSVAMRLELKEGINGCLIVNDSYNSDINSLSIALDYLSTIAAKREKVVILSDILQSGLYADDLYEEVARLASVKGVGELIGIGKEISQHANLFRCKTAFFSSTEDFLKTYSRSNFINKAILIKGCRPFHFEKISRTLERKIHTTVLEVNLDNMIHNLNYFRAKLRPGVKMMAMVKAMGYGSGTYEVANMLQNQGVDFLAVAFADEGVVLREAGITMPIVVLNADNDSFELMIDYNLEPEIYNMTSLRDFADAVRKHGENSYPIHIKLDTGMHRLGFEKKDIDLLITTLKNQSELYIRTIFSHLCGSDEHEHDDFTKHQIALFKELTDKLIAAFPEQNIIRHISNSAGIERFPEAQFDMVRLGIGLYGISFDHQEHMLPVSTLKSRIVQIKELEAGETVGYGRHGKVTSHMRTATVPIGYADGLDRHLSRGNWSFLVNGHKAPIVGNICMDTCMIDVTGIDVHEGDTVTIFGEDPTIIEMAERLGTIPYEILTSVAVRVKRVYLKE